MIEYIVWLACEIIPYFEMSARRKKIIYCDNSWQREVDGKPKGKSKLLISRSPHYLGNHSDSSRFQPLPVHPLPPRPAAAMVHPPNYIVANPLPAALISSRFLPPSISRQLGNLIFARDAVWNLQAMLICDIENPLLVPGSKNGLIQILDISTYVYTTEWIKSTFVRIIDFRYNTIPLFTYSYTKWDCRLFLTW